MGLSVCGDVYMKRERETSVLAEPETGRVYPALHLMMKNIRDIFELGLVNYNRVGICLRKRVTQSLTRRCLLGMPGAVCVCRVESHGTGAIKYVSGALCVTV